MIAALVGVPGPVRADVGVRFDPPEPATGQPFSITGLPAMSVGRQNPTSPSQQSIFKAWEQLNSHDGLVPYLDYATPTFYQALTAELLDLTSGRSSPHEFVGDLQDNYSTF